MKHGTTVTLRVALLVVAMLLGLCPVALAQEVVDPFPACVPMATWLAEQMDVPCEDLMALHDDGAGFGEIMMAWRVSQLAPEGSEVTWEELLEAHLAGEGWGERLFAYRLSPVLDVDPETLLALKQEGLGWGEMSHAAAVAESEGISFEEAAALFAGGVGWDEIREELGLEEGPPPWARGRGPAGGVEDEDEGSEGDALVAGAEEEKPAGRPAWAGTPGGPEKDKEPGAQGRAQSQGRGRP